MQAESEKRMLPGFDTREAAEATNFTFSVKTARKVSRGLWTPWLNNLVIPNPIVNLSMNSLNFKVKHMAVNRLSLYSDLTF